jgi:hypothetical protein
MCYHPNVIVSRSHNNEQHGGTASLWMTRYQRHFRTGKLRMAVSLRKFSTFISIIVLLHLTVLLLFYFWVLSLTATDAEPLNLEMECISAASQWRTQEIFRGRGSTNSVEDRGQRERGSGGGSPLVRGSGGSCILVQEISFHIVNFY